MAAYSKNASSLRSLPQVPLNFLFDVIENNLTYVVLLTKHEIGLSYLGFRSIYGSTSGRSIRSKKSSLESSEEISEAGPELTTGFGGDFVITNTV